MTARPLGLVTCLMALSLVSCQTTPKTTALDEAPVTPLLSEFLPASFVTGIKLIEGRNPSLYAPDCYAIWMGEDVAAFRRNEAVSKGDAPDTVFDSAVTRVVRNYLVFECHMISAFGDASIAYDAVGLRSVVPKLVLPGDNTLTPVQVISGSAVKESHVGALRRFERMVYVVFQKRDLQKQTDLVGPDTTAVQLRLDGYGSAFGFEWGTSVQPPPPANPALEQTKRILKTGFRESYGKLVQLLHATE